MNNHQNLPTVRLSADPILRIMSEEEQAKIGHGRIKLMLENGIRMFDADKMAVARGFHPFELWGDAWIKEYPQQDDQVLEEVISIVKEHGPMSKNQLFKLITTRSSTQTKRRAIQEAIDSMCIIEEHSINGKRNIHVLTYSGEARHG